MKEAIAFAQSLYSPPGGERVDFRDGAQIRWMHKIWQLALKSRVSNSEVVFACRAEMGLYNLLHQIHAEVETSALNERLEKIAGKKVAKTTNLDDQI